MKTTGFFKQVKMDWWRSIFSIRFALFVLCFAALLSASEVSQFVSVIRQRETGTVMQIIFHNIVMDKFKIIMILLLACIYTKSFCDDYNSNYLRCILTRIDVSFYAQSKIVVNAFSNILGSVLGFSISTVFLSFFVPLVSEEIDVGNNTLAIEHPIGYILLMGLVFGLVAAACSTIGMLISAFQPNAFVSIAMAGLIFFLVVSYIPSNSIFDVLSVIMFLPTFTKGDETGILDILWNIMYPALVIYICGVLFRKKLEWRVKNGYI
jgi:hypothetical protein